ncbi:glycosyltransferase family 22 protein [Cristinia sonorae]|uniref:Mannosyltransferase n=1 Tax=Cristinia sonorae TaxID=1940300 RepID=A0A8K0UXY5_9AGAR|nr:glycosyltransferase family 22 protein [Cristinia sonorae]
MSSIRTSHYVTIAILVRVGIALLTRSYFQPDEYFQSLEVAHHFVFGYGHLTWEWLSPVPIRSFLYPALNVPIYWLLRTLKLDDTQLIILGPRVLHGLLAACADIWLTKLTKVMIGNNYVSVAYLLSLTSFFNALSLSRSLSNSLETTLTTIALSFYPWQISYSWRSDTRRCLAFAAVACAVRPTNAVIWVYMFAVLLWRTRNELSRLLAVLVDASTIAFIAAGVIAALDSLYYGKITFTPLNFLLTNLSPVSLFYGSNPWHFYIFQALPILCTTALPFVLHGSWLSFKQPAARNLRVVLGLLVWTIGIYSAAGHKEWRFIHPLLPLLHILAAKSIVDSSPHIKQESSRTLPIRRSFKWLVLLPLPAIVYIVWFHARAQIDVIYYLQNLATTDVQSAGFLMPCHSTPWQAYLHRPQWTDEGSFWSLGCEPPLAGQDLAGYRDQIAVFLDAPVAYLQTRFPPEVNPAFPRSPRPFSIPGATNQLHDWSHEWPQYIVMFGALLRKPGVRELLTDRGYSIVWDKEFGWDGDENRQGGVKVWKYLGHDSVSS